MLRILVTCQTRYPTDVKTLKNRVKAVLFEHGVEEAEVSITIVGERKMRELGKKYLHETKEDDVHEVLSFPFTDLTHSKSNDFMIPPDEKLRLGDIIICYPEARDIAMKKNRMVDDVLCELAEHGTLHLLGIHHG